MKSIAKSLAASALTCLAFTASADSPHFLEATARFNSDYQLQVCFKEAGVAANQLINFEATANATATYACVASQSSGGRLKGAPSCPGQTTTVDGRVSGTAE